LQAALPEGLFYHGMHHTLDVCNAAEEIALAEGIDGEDLHILKSAALFHDAGFTKQYTANEPIGCEMARATLPEFGYSDKQIKMVENLIMATQVPQKATTLLEKIICDADLDYLGREDFPEIADTLRQELLAFGKIQSTQQWDEIQVMFLTKHKYFTETNIKRRNPTKLKHLEEVKKRVAGYGNSEG
jgi:predicted metal-dependent HD superfamily phosphohydrolase